MESFRLIIVRPTDRFDELLGRLPLIVKQETGMGHSFDAEEVRQRLLAGTYRPPITVVGFAKAEDEEKGMILVSPSEDCRSWVRIPTQQIVDIQHLGMVACEDHTHPRVRITLEAVDPGNEQAVLLAELLHSRADAQNQPLQDLQAVARADRWHAAFLKVILDHVSEVFGPTYYGGGRQNRGYVMAEIEVENRSTGQRGVGAIVQRGNCRSARRIALERACRDAGCDPRRPNTYIILSESCDDPYN